MRLNTACRLPDSESGQECMKAHVASNSSQDVNLKGSRKWRRAHSSLMLFWRGVPVTRSLFLKLHVISSLYSADSLFFSLHQGGA